MMSNKRNSTGSRQNSVERRWFALGCAILACACGFAIWGFSQDTLGADQRRLLTWILALASGFCTGAFAGSISVKARGLIPGMAVTATSGFAAWLICFWFLFPSTSSIEKPKVLLMESALPEVVYDPKTREAGGTNADDLTEILKDLPVQLIAETTNLQWRREQQILELEPDLIIIHLSCFYSKTDVLDSDERFRSFLRYMIQSKAKFLVYTRGPHGNVTQQLNNRWDAHLTFLHNNIPSDRIKVFIVDGGSQATFRDPTTARNLKMEVKKMLGL
jgi:hypothetical protein